MFNLDLNKQAQPAIFSRKKPFHPQVFFNEVPVECIVSQKHLYLNEYLHFSEHFNEKISKVQRGSISP